MKRALIAMVAFVAAMSAFVLMRPPLGEPEPQPIISAGAFGDAALGRKLFVTKSCVTCHQVRGVGGKVGPPLDLVRSSDAPAPEDFIAAIWRGAPIMVELQRLEIGYQIDLEGDELLHLAAFASDSAEQDAFTIDQVPPELRELFLDEIYMDDLEDFYDRYEGEEWYDFSDGPRED